MKNPLIAITLTLLFSAGINASAQEPDFSMNGYAAVEGEGYATTTGGEGGDTTIVSTYEELDAFARDREKNTTPAVLCIKGYIEANPTTVVTFKHGANLTILGADSGAELYGVGIRIWDYYNVIVRNLKIHEIFYPDDALSIEESQHVWIDHNELYSKMGSDIGMDTYDGLLDIKKGSRYITVSWNHLHDHMKCMLIGHTDNASQGEADQLMRVTIHHNIFENTSGRNPSLRWGAAHIYNNYYFDIEDYAIALRQGAHGLIENNCFNNVKTSISTNKFDGEGFACLSGNVYEGTTLESNNSITQTDCDFWSSLPYTYQLDSTGNLETLLRANVGIGIISTLETENSDTTGIRNLAANQPSSLKCYPNPATDQLTISFQGTTGKQYKLSIFNLEGRMVYSKDITCYSTQETQLLINLTSWNNGFYLVRFGEEVAPLGSQTFGSRTFQVRQNQGIRSF